MLPQGLLYKSNGLFEGEDLDLKVRVRASVNLFAVYVRSSPGAGPRSDPVKVPVDGLSVETRTCGPRPGKITPKFLTKVEAQGRI